MVLVIDNHKALVAWASKQQPATIYFDTETTGLNPRADELVALQLLPAGQSETVVVDVRRMPAWVPVLKPLLEGAKLVGHNLKFDLRFLYEFGIAPQKVWDTMLAEQVIEGVGLSDARLRNIGLGLEDVTKKYTAAAMSKEERSWFVGLRQRAEEWAAPFPAAQLEYMAADVAHLAAIAKAQKKRLRAEDLMAVATLEQAVVPALVAMEAKGVRVDVDGWRAFIAAKQLEADALEAECLEEYALPILEARLAKYDEANAALQEWQAARDKQVAILEAAYESVRQGVTWGEYKRRFMDGWRQLHPRPETPKQDASLPNLNSQQQLLDAFHAWGIPLESTSSQVLADVDDERVTKLVAYRKAIKFVQTFGESLLEKVEDGRIHPDYVQIGASTGRMACRNPNWQQLPAKGDGQKLRALVVPDAGNVLVVADFSNIELRILAFLSQDKTLKAAFEGGLDLHAELAYKVFSLPRDVDVATAEYAPGWTYRQLMKTINYGLVYGMSAVRLARLMRVPREKAQAIMDDYFSQLGGVRKWMAAKRAEGVALERVYTVGGRVRRFQTPTDFGERARVERQAANTPIQGTSADITKLAVAYVHQAIASREGWHLVAVVHDELVLEVPQAEGERASQILAYCMDRAQRMFVKLEGQALPKPKPVASGHWTH